MTVFEYERRAVLGSDARDSAAYYGCSETLPAFADEVRAVAVGEKSDAVDEHEAAVFAAVVISHIEQHIAPELSPERTFPRLYASLSASSAPVALNVFIMNSRFPPPA